MQTTVLTRQAEAALRLLALFPGSRLLLAFGIVIEPHGSPSPALLSLYATFIHRLIKCESNWVTVVWSKSSFVLIVLSVFSPFLCRGHRLVPGDDEMYQRTTVSVMQKEPSSGALINSYSSQGFIIDGNRVLGPCAVLPPAILQWNVSPAVPHVLLFCSLVSSN